MDRLLASPQYGEHWGRHWLDVVRYADARDLIQLPPPSDFREAWLYRDWVVDAFNRDLPYTEFIRHQIARDLVPPSRPGGINRDGLVATGMLAIADFVPGDVDKDLMIADYVNDQIDVVSSAAPSWRDFYASPVPAVTITSSIRTRPRITTPWPVSFSALGSSPVPCPATRRSSVCR